MGTWPVKSSGKNLFPVILPSAAGAAAVSFIYYCEKLQFIPLLTKTALLSIAAAFSAGALAFGIIFLFLRGALSGLSKRELPALLPAALILSVCLMVWLPVPRTGIYAPHTLEIRALPDEEGKIRPVTLTWLHRENGDIPLSAARCEGNCRTGPYGPEIADETGRITWTGKTGDLITVEFVSAADQGIAEIRWDEDILTAPLNNESLDRLSYDHAFPPSAGLPEAAAVWAVSFLTAFAALLAAVKLLPRWSVRGFGIGAFICFVIFRVLQFRTAAEPFFFVDSESYLGMSRMPVKDILLGVPYCHSQYWYCIARPALIPLLYKLCRQDPQIITAAQLAVSLFCWGFFALQASRLCRGDAGKKAVTALSLGLGCVPNVTRWDQVIMSESFSISAALLLAGSLFLLTAPDKEKRWRPLPAVLTACGALFYVQTRDSASWSVILVIILLLCVCRAGSGRKVILTLCVFLAAVCWSVMGNTGGRWQYPFENVLFTRILPNPQGESFFREAGMPMPPRIKELYGTEHMMGSELFNSDGMAPLREWILSDGLKTYIRYMFREPVKTLRMAWPGFEKEAFEQIDYRFSPKGFRALLPDPVIKFFSCNLPAVLLIGFSLAGIFAAFRRKDGIRFAFPLLFILSSYLLCTGVLIADEYEFERHSLVIILLMKASAWPLLCCLAEELFSGKTGKEEPL